MAGAMWWCNFKAERSTIKLMQLYNAVSTHYTQYQWKARVLGIAPLNERSRYQERFYNSKSGGWLALAIVPWRKVTASQYSPRNGLWTRSYASSRHTTPQSTTLGLHPVIHVSNYMDHYSFTDPWGMDGWVGHVGWLTADVWPTKWSSVQLAVSQWKFAGQRPAFYHCAMPPTGVHSIGCKESSPKWPIVCWVGRYTQYYTIHTHSLTHCRYKWQWRSHFSMLYWLLDFFFHSYIRHTFKSRLIILFNYSLFLNYA